jgi:dipeptidyl aminopeptidase/acylaminoacyl peptidase
MSCSKTSSQPAPQVAPYGTWASPLTAARVTAGSLRFDHIVLDGDDVYWIEGRASEGGRSVVVRRTRDGHISDVTPAGFNVRSRVHEYGGAPYVVDRGVVFFSNFSDQRLYRQAGRAAPTPITANGYFYADATVERGGSRLLLVREDHTKGDAEPPNTIVSVAMDGSREQVLVSGADFYSDPIVSPDGTRFAWIQWDHPNMPWDGTELWVADMQRDGSLGARTKIAGGGDESIIQPEWSPDGRLYFVSDRTGWWNLYRQSGAGVEAMQPMAAEFGRPQWTFGSSSYAFITATRLAVSYTQGGRWQLALMETDPRKFEPIDLRLEALESIGANTHAVYFIGGSPTEPPAIARMTLAAAEAEILRSASSDRIDPAWISVPEAITFKSRGMDVHAFHYAPKNPEFTAPAGERPPLLVLSHGGPTAATIDLLDGRIQFWTSRGFAVLDVNYSGSSGYGREYRDRLKGEWGVLDVANCVDGAKHLVAIGKADANRLIIRGGSAGGYTTLSALTFHDVFKAGASYYGISDIEGLARDTHKFESQYLDSMVGPYPAKKDLYVQRSPIHFTDRLSCALILFQGLEDKVVPPNQSEMMAEAVRRKGLPVAYVPFAGEQHGFRKAENMVRSLEAELYFYAAVFKFPIADRIEPVPIDNLR